MEHQIEITRRGERPRCACSAVPLRRLSTHVQILPSRTTPCTTHAYASLASLRTPVSGEGMHACSSSVASVYALSSLRVSSPVDTTAGLEPMAHYETLRATEPFRPAFLFILSAFASATCFISPLSSTDTYVKSSPSTYKEGAVSTMTRVVCRATTRCTSTRPQNS